MKLTVLVTSFFACAAVSSAAFYPLALGPFHGITEMDNADLAYLRQQYARPKRSGSGSGDVLNSLKASIGQGIKSKLGMIGKASSGHYSPHYYPKEDHKPPFDIWGFKKSLLYTLLQAVKAIKGGVIAIKGQLIKGGGHLLATKGTIIKGGGEALSNLGKSIATSAFMIVPHDDYEEHYEHVAPSSYGHSGPGPEVHHSAPSATGPEYGPPGYPQKYNSVYDGKHEHDGIVILKKIPHGHGHGEHEGQESKPETEFKPLKEVTYSGVKNLMGSVFSASSSSTPDHPPHRPKHYEYPQKQQQQPHYEHDYPPHPQPYPPRQYEYNQHKDQEHSADAPSTSYGVPAKVIKHPEYYIAPAETGNPNQNKPQMFVTPSPPTETEVPITYKLEIPKHLSQQHQQKENSQIFIGMHVPVDYQQLTDNSQDYLTEFKLSPTPYSQQIPTKFLINYPDPTELALARDAFPQPSRHVPKRAGPRPPHKLPTKRSPNLEILRSVAYELRPDSRPLKY